MSNRGSNLQFGHFLTYSTWEQALKLLNYKISEKKPPKPNRHYNTINFYYFEKISNDLHKLESEEYFNEKISNNFFYGLEKEFFYFHYTIPKSGIGIRKYVFFSYPMNILYYSIGLYLLKITQQFIEDVKKEHNIKTSYYGGDLKFTKDKINANHGATYYKYHYDSFKKEIKKQTKENFDEKVVIKLDIQNYYETILVEKLLELVSCHVKPSVLKEYNFDTSTQEMILFYFYFINNGNIEIPQGYTNTISSFIGYFYLIFGDLFISDLIEEFKLAYPEHIKKHQIIRYVDDTYISLVFSEDTSKSEKESISYELLKNISDCFYLKLNLRFNSKLELFFLENEDDRNSLINSVKKTSPDIAINDEDNVDNPQTKFDKIVDSIKEIKNSELSFVFKKRKHEKYLESLNEVYDKPVEQIIKKPSNINILEEIFSGFNFDLFRIHPKVFIILISQTNIAKSNFVSYLINKEPLTTFDVDLIVNFLAQNGFNQETLLKKLKDNNSIKPIIEQYINPVLIHNLDFYNVDFSVLNKISEDVNISEQTRLRVYHEKLGNYSVAFNHLLNELHAICRLKDEGSGNPKEYNAAKVIKYLSKLKVNSLTKTKIRNLFDRRNKNPVSHPGSNEIIAWAVSKNEYIEYKNYVEECLSYILGVKKSIIRSSF